MRKLASIKRISNILPIEGKDRIALAVVDGWQVIVQKADYEVGGLCVFCEIDSVFPEKPEFEFLRSKGFRIKTMKMAGVISQGICFPLSILPPKPNGEYELEEDVTDILGIVQYEATKDNDPVPKKESKKYPRWLMRIPLFRAIVLRKKKKGDFPSFISKTDETRIQNAPFYLEIDATWVATEKVDGQSGTFALLRHKRIWPFKDKFEYIVCSRNLRLPEPDNSSYWKVSEKYKIKNVLRNLIGKRDFVAIQGECVGPGIQGNKYKFDETDLYVFNLIYPDGRASSPRAKSIIENHGMKFVPIIDTNVRLPKTVNEVLDMAHGDSVLGNTIREGIVFRSQDGKQSFKAVDPLFLMKYNE